MNSQSASKIGDLSEFDSVLINLDIRKDRLSEALPQIAKLGFRNRILKATDASEIWAESPFLSKPVEACFISHFRAFKEIADGDREFCFVLEDDFQVVNYRKLFRQVRKIEYFSYDLIQFGWLQNTLRDRILIYLTTLEGRFFHLIFMLSKKFPFFYHRVGNRLRVKRNAETYNHSLVQDDFKSGGHFYLVSRTFAQKLSEINPQPQVPIDNFLANLAAGRKFKIARTSKSYVSQSNSPSSIKKS